MELISGTEVSKHIKKEIAQEVEKIVNRGERAPKLIAIIVGNDPASLTYVGHKEKMCKEVGFDSQLISLGEETTQEQLIDLIHKLNNDDTVDGFIIQLPLPKHIDEDAIIMEINPLKDVDGFHPTNVGKMVTGNDSFVSATPYGIVELLKYYKVQTSGKHVVVVGRSNIVGRPISNLLSQKCEFGNATLTICHSKTENLANFTRQADILIVATGALNVVNGDMVKDGVVVIDVGMHRIPDETRKNGFRLEGDVDFDSVAPKCSMITPVPGGVGPMTIISLMRNTLKAIKYRK